MKQKYDNNYSWLHQHMQQHLGIESQGKAGDEAHHTEQQHDGINTESDVIISEYRLLYLKYKEQIAMYKEAIANLSLKQIINNEEEAWVQHRMQHEQADQNRRRDDSVRNSDGSLAAGGTFRENDNFVLNSQADRIVSNVKAYEFEEEINHLSVQLKDKIRQLRKDYTDLKIFQNEHDIQNAREKLLVFIRKLITDTNALIATIQRNFNRNLDSMNQRAAPQLPPSSLLE